MIWLVLFAWWDLTFSILQRNRKFGFCMRSLMSISLCFRRILFLIRMLWVVVIFSVSPVLVHLLLCFSWKALKQQVQSQSVQYAERFVVSIWRNWEAVMDIKNTPFYVILVLSCIYLFFLGNETNWYFKLQFDIPLYTNIWTWSYYYTICRAFSLAFSILITDAFSIKICNFLS